MTGAESVRSILEVEAGVLVWSQTMKGGGCHAEESGLGPEDSGATEDG